MTDRPALGRQLPRLDLGAEATGALGPLGGAHQAVQSLIGSRGVLKWTPDKMPLLGEGVARAATTLLGVAALGEPDLLVEVEATAVMN